MLADGLCFELSVLRLAVVGPRGGMARDAGSCRFAVVASHTWSHKRSTLCPSSTESSGDFKKNVVLVSVTPFAGLELELVTGVV